MIVDHEGIKHHIYHTALQTLEKRLEHAWVCKVGALVACREGFQGMEFVSTSLTLPQGMPTDQESGGLLRTVLNGTFFTRDKQYSCGTVASTRCPFCQATDGIIHRHYSCQHFQKERDQLPKHIFTFLDEAPPCTVQHGWICEPAEVRLLRSELASLPDLTGDFIGQWVHQLSDPIHLFCDGSCIQPTIPELRVATWGVCIANLEEDTFSPLSQGPVWGIHQSSTRADFTAAISSIRFALHIRKQCWIWTDNQTVFEFLQCTWKPEFSVHIMDKDHDLRTTLLTLSRRAQQLDLLGSVMKVRSHMKLEAFTDVVEQWAIHGNTFADHCAETARSGFHPNFWSLWEAASQQIFYLREVCTVLHSFFISIGQKVLSQKDAIWEQDELEQDLCHTETRPTTDLVASLSWQNVPDDFNFGVTGFNNWCPRKRVGVQINGIAHINFLHCFKR